MKPIPILFLLIVNFGCQSMISKPGFEIKTALEYCLDSCSQAKDPSSRYYPCTLTNNSYESIQIPLFAFSCRKGFFAMAEVNYEFQKTDTSWANAGVDIRYLPTPDTTIHLGKGDHFDFFLETNPLLNPESNRHIPVYGITGQIDSKFYSIGFPLTSF
jgi:hypothetical protein